MLLPVCKTKEHDFGLVNVMAYWDREDKEVRYAATSRHASKSTLNWGKRRSWIDSTFKDLGSRGYPLRVGFSLNLVS